MTTSEARVVEPLAKFHAKVYVKGRIRIINNEREFLELTDGDIVKLIIRTLDEEKKPVARAYFEGMLVSGGNVTIPLGLRRELDISDGDFIEVLLLSYIKIEDVIGEKGLKIMKALRLNDYRIISEKDEKRLLSSLSIAQVQHSQHAGVTL